GVTGWVYQIRLKVERDEAQHQREAAESAEQEARASQTKAETARAETDRARERAEKNFQQARDAVDQMLTRVGHQRLARQPGMQRVRRELLEQALAFYQRFCEDRATDSAVLAEKGRAYQRLGEI